MVGEGRLETDPVVVHLALDLPLESPLSLDEKTLGSGVTVERCSDGEKAKDVREIMVASQVGRSLEIRGNVPRMYLKRARKAPQYTKR